MGANPVQDLLQGSSIFFYMKPQEKRRMAYLKSPQGILKMLEIVAICIAFSCLADFDNDSKTFRDFDDKYATRFDLFIAVIVIGFVFVLFVFLVCLCGAETKITTEKNWSLLLLIFSLVFALLFVVASALFVDHPLKPFYDIGLDKDILTRILTVGVFFGFLSAVLLLVDAFLAWTKIGKESPGSNA